MQNPASLPIRLAGSLIAIAALFFGIAAVALQTEVGGPVEAAEETTTTTSEPTTTTSSSAQAEPTLTFPVPYLEQVAVAPDDSSTTTEVPQATSTSTPTTSKPTTTSTAPPNTTATPPPPSSSVPPPAQAPDGAVIVNPGDNIQQIVNAHPAGTTFYLRAGIHSSPGGTRHVDPKSGNVFIGESGAVMDGGGNTQFAFQDNMKGANVTIRGLVIRNYSTPQQRGAVDAGSGGWTVIGNEIHNNAAAGVALAGSSWVIEGNNIHHNEQIGIKGQGSGGRVVNNTIAHNNPNKRFEAAWEAGGTKFVNTTNLYVGGNRVLNNRGPGLWTDGNNSGTLYENNTVRDNVGPGIFHEISQSATIRNNTVTGNAHGFYIGGILVANSSNVSVLGNTVSGNHGGIIGLQDDRGGHNTLHLVVKQNAVSFSSGVQGIIHNSGSDVTQSGTITFDENGYGSSAAKPFRWGKTTMTFQEWQAIGQDINGWFG